MPRRFDGLIMGLGSGIEIDGISIRAEGVRVGRFREERNMEVVASRGGRKARLMSLKVFDGRPPYYSPWIEVFSISDPIDLGEPLPYYGSRMEAGLLSLLSNHLGPGEYIFIEYEGDEETYYQLDHDVPPQLTRLGHLLFELGFTWFKDWYFPEGFMEGGRKLQAVKPRPDEVEARLKGLLEEARSFLEGVDPGDHPYMLRALERARRMAGSI